MLRSKKVPEVVPWLANKQLYIAGELSSAKRSLSLLYYIANKLLTSGKPVVRQT